MKELENKNIEGEYEDSLKECFEYEDLKAKVVELEKYGVNSSKDQCNKLEDQIVEYEGEQVEMRV